MRGGGGHAVDTRIPGRHQRHRPPFPRLRQGLSHTLQLRRHRLGDDLLPVQQPIQQLDVPGVADDDVGLGDRLPRTPGHVLQPTRADTDQQDPSTAHDDILARETVAWRPSGPRTRCFSTRRHPLSLPELELTPEASSAAASDTDGVLVWRRTVSEGLGTGTSASRTAGSNRIRQP